MTSVLKMSKKIDNFKKNIQQGIYGPPGDCHYTQISVNVNDDIMKIILGKNGKYFKAITHQSGVKYIWWNKEKNIVEIWGPENKLQYAISRLMARYEMIIKRINNGTIKIKSSEPQDTQQQSMVLD